MLLKLGELQELVYHNHYDRDATDKGNPRTGWALVLTTQDLAQILEAPVPESAVKLAATWGGNWDRLGHEQTSADAIVDGIELVRSDTKNLLRNLD